MSDSPPGKFKDISIFAPISIALGGLYVSINNNAIITKKHRIKIFIPIKPNSAKNDVETQNWFESISKFYENNKLPSWNF